MFGRVTALAACLVLGVALVGCGGDATEESASTGAGSSEAEATTERTVFAGRFDGAVNGAAVRMTLREEGDRLTGDFVEGMASYAVTATREGATANGTMSHRVMGFELPFTARLDGDALAIEIRGNRTVELSLKRTTGEAEAASNESPASTATANVERDPRLVGVWKREIIANRRNAAPGYNVTTHVTSHLLANGRFRYGGGQSVITLTDPGRMPSSGMSGASPVIEGEWKTENGVLFSKRDGTQTWIPLGRYSLSGNAMVVYTLDGAKQLWERR